MASLAELKADIMTCVSHARTKEGLLRCARFKAGSKGAKPRKPKGAKKGYRYRYTTAKGRKARAKGRKGGKGKRKS